MRTKEEKENLHPTLIRLKQETVQQGKLLKSAGFWPSQIMRDAIEKAFREYIQIAKDKGLLKEVKDDKQ